MKEIYALYISLAALLVSVFSLGWNFYRDVILKPRLKVTIKISKIFQPGGKDFGDYIDVSAVNLGPGAIVCNGVLGQEKRSFRHLLKKPKYLYAKSDTPLTTPLPKKLEIGDSITQLFNHKPDAFLSLDPARVGIRDTFGRMHWASRKSLKSAKKDFLKGFQKIDKSKGQLP